jgi:hypothetical protein
MHVKKIAIVQSNYIPWKGYFDMIASVDEFILYEDAQYTRRDWRNRNKIKTAQGLQWLTVPVKVKGNFHQLIRDTRIDGEGWAEAHWKAISQTYRRSAHFDTIASLFKPLYTDNRYDSLSVLNKTLIEAVCRYLGITTSIRSSSDYAMMQGSPSERLADLCSQAKGTEYISGPAAKDYLEESAFAVRGMTVSWFDYAGYPEYPQLWGAFTHGVTILDLLFNCGEEAPNYMRYVRQ